MRPKLNLLIVMFAMALACLTLAQGGGGGRQGRRGGRNPYAITTLVFRSDVQSELAITEDEKTKLTDLQPSLTPQRPAQGEPRPSREEMMARQQENEKKVEALLTADQVKRIHEIQIQLMGPAALGVPHVQTDLGLSADQTAKLKTIFQTYQEANQSVGQKLRDGTIDQTTATSDRAKNTAELKSESEKVLTPDQMAKFQAMGGKPFTPAAPPAPAGN